MLIHTYVINNWKLRLNVGVVCHISGLKKENFANNHNAKSQEIVGGKVPSDLSKDLCSTISRIKSKGVKKTPGPING